MISNKKKDGALDRTDWTRYIENPPDTKLYWGTEKSEYNELQYAECDTGGEDRYYGKAHNHEYPGPSQNYDIQGKYGHFCTSDGAGRRVPNLPGGPDQWPNILAKLWKFPPVTAVSYLDDRCYCPSIPPTPNPRYKEPPEVQVAKYQISLDFQLTCMILYASCFRILHFMHCQIF